MDIIHSVAWLNQHNHKVLCVRTKGKDKFYLPGGKINDGETPQQALIREINEELGIYLLKKSLVPVVTINEKAHGFSDTCVNMQCFYADYQGDIQANAEIAEFKWIGEQELSLCALAAQKAMRFIML